MTPLTLFGVVTLAAMLVFYALEARSPVYVLLFAVACVGSSAYGFLQGAWPFGVVEAIWTGVAFRRWRACLRADARSSGPTDSRPIACDMSAFTPDERRQYNALRSRVTSSVTGTAGTDTGFRMRLDDSMTLPEIAEWVGLERRCCPFLTITLAVQPDEARWVELGGSRAIREFLSKEFASAVR